jgi:hypothetical protein
MLSISEALQTNTNLEELVVDDNRITFGDRDEAGNDFATTVYELLTANPTHKSLDIRHNHFDEVTLNSLALTMPRIHLKGLYFGLYDGVSVDVISNLARGLLGDNS